MASREYRAFALELRNMSAYDVRQHTETSFETDAAKRAMAVTELERRRQASAQENAKDRITGRIVFLMTVVIAAAVAAYWKFY